MPDGDRLLFLAFLLVVNREGKNWQEDGHHKAIGNYKGVSIRIHSSIPFIEPVWLRI